MFLSAKTVKLSDCHCILTSQLCSCCQPALHINATHVSQASFFSILINKPFVYFSEARQGSAGFAALGWLNPFVHFVSSPLLWSLRATAWVILPPDVTCMLSSNHQDHQWTLCISVHALKKDKIINNWSAAHNFSFVSDVSWWPGCWMCILITKRCALCRPRSWQRTFGCSTQIRQIIIMLVRCMDLIN